MLNGLSGMSVAVPAAGPGRCTMAQESAQPKEAVAGGTKSRKKLMLPAVAILLLMGVAGGGFFWWQGRPAADAAATDTQAHGAASDGHVAVSGALPFEPFVVNLADPEGSRYLKADVRLVVSGAESIDELKEDEVVMLRLRSAILEHLSQKTATELTTAGGKETLKEEIAERCTKILGHAKVSDVLFAEFVVQF